MTISGERVFGKVDAALRRAPNVDISKVESKTMYTCNRTRTWLAAKTGVEKQKEIFTARRDAAGIRCLEKERKSSFQERLREKLHVKRVELTEKESKRRDVCEKLIEDAIKVGLWSLDTIDQELDGKSTTRQKVALRLQINVITKIVGLKTDKKLAVTQATIPFHEQCSGIWINNVGWLVEWGFYALSASKAIFRARTYNCNLFSPVMMIT